MSIFVRLNSDMSLDEMKKIIKDNSAKAMTLKNKIKAIDSMSKKSSDFVMDYDLTLNETEEEIVESIENDEEEFKYYYSNIREAISSGEDLKSAIYDNLPVLENKNYVNIVRRIILEFIQEKEIYSEYASVDQEAIKEMNRIDTIIDIIKGHHTAKEENIALSENKKNNIIFLRTSSGNIYAESDLASIDSEWYLGFKGLLESIEDGTFKNVKRLTSNPISQGIPEVKDTGIRIVFDKINYNTYIVLDMLVKKSDHDKGYSNQLINRLAFYRQHEKEIKESVTDELIESDRVILENIKQGLNNKSIVKSKGGDHNGL